MNEKGIRQDGRPELGSLSAALGDIDRETEEFFSTRNNLPSIDEIKARLAVDYVKAIGLGEELGMHASSIQGRLWTDMLRKELEKRSE